MIQGIKISNHPIGLGDGIQFSSLPENYYYTKGEKLLDIDRPWFFDHNPYVIRDDKIKPDKVFTMWNWPKGYDWPVLRHTRVYLSNAEIWAALLNVPVVMNKPRLYKFEDFPFEKREKIFFHIDGKSHGMLPDHVIDHVVKKYGPTGQLYQIGTTDRDIGIPKVKTDTLWQLAELLSQARMFIGIDSGPSWVAACYHDVVVKKIRVRQNEGKFDKWVPLEVDNIHSHWDDRGHQVFNVSERDIGFTYAYWRL